MTLERTVALLAGTHDTTDARKLMIEVLAASIELVSLDDNNFLWSSWNDAASAVAELRSHLDAVATSNNVNLDELSVLFAATGPMQELSISSGWGEPFVKLASYFDLASETLKAQRFMAISKVDR
jgi:hypothetical protein